MDENTSNFGDDKDLPKLSIEQENAFKKMKMSLESNAIFPENFSKMLPPEVESAFLDGIMQFEQLYRNAKRISVFERIGSPKLKNSEEFSDEAVALELKKLISKLKRKGIAFSAYYFNSKRCL